MNNTSFFFIHFFRRKRMKKIIPFDKQIEFPSMIGEITSISLDHNLYFKDESNIQGNITITGTYKRTEATRLEEDFSFEIPTEIILTEKIDINTSKIEIDDFYYELEKEDIVNCHISIMVEGMEIVELEEDIPELENHQSIISEIIKEDIDVRECDGDNTYEETYPNIMLNEEIVESETKNMEIAETEKEDVGSLFTALKDSEETFSTYSVYIVRNDETIENIISKFKTTKEELEAYNDLSTFKVGSKIIIPMNEKN